MRGVIWLIVSAILFCGALSIWGMALPYSGAAGTPWEDFVPRGTAPMLVVSGVLLGTYCLCVCFRVTRLIWFFLAAISFVPTFAAFYSCWIEHKFAVGEWLHPWEGSDVAFPLYTAESTLLLSIIFDALLLDITLYGYLFRGRSDRN